MHFVLSIDYQYYIEHFMYCFFLIVFFKCFFFNVTFMVNVLKFRTLVACQKGIEDSAGTDQTAYKTRIFSVCYSDKHFRG